jgi:signal transduction histidine kinase
MVSPIQILLLILMASHILLLGFVYKRRGDHSQRRAFLLGWIATNVALMAVQFLPEDLLTTPLNNTALLWLGIVLQTILLGGYLHYDIGVQYPKVSRRLWAWWGLGLVWLITVIASLFLLDTAPSGWRTWQVTEGLAPVAFMASGLLLILGILALVLMVNFYKANMAELANRTAMILLMLTTYLSAHFLLLSGNNTLESPAFFILTLVGVVLAYANHYYRVLDIRHTIITIFELSLITILTSGIVLAGLLFVRNIPPELRLSPIVLFMVALFIAILHIPIRQFILLIFMPLQQQSRINLVRLMREYSNQMTHVASLDEVVKATQDTLSNTMQIQRVAFILINNTFLQPNSAELIILGQEKPEGDAHFLHNESPIFKSLALKKIPLGTYDLRFNPIFKQAAPNEHAFFAALGMDIYIPIVSENILLGILACGAKGDGLAYSRDDVQKLLVIGEQIGNALRSTRLIDDLQHLNKSTRRLNERLEDAKKELEKLDAVKTDFITIASHELRTPLAQIRGYTDIIDSLNEQKALEPQQTTKMVANLRKSTERMEELISAMLDVSQLDVDAMDLRPMNTTPETFIRLSIDPLQDAFTQRNLTLVREGLEKLPSVHVDMQRVVQAFRNLIINAIKFTPDGGTITISGKHEPAKDKDDVDYIRISIEDTGVGIDEKNLVLIFQKFYRGFDTQLHSTGMYKFMGAGPGLGLTIARGIIEGHGGKIWATSPGHNVEALPGTTFHVRIPTKPPEGTSGVLAIQDDSKSAPDNIKRTLETKAIHN